MSLPEQSKQDGGDGEDIQEFDFLRKSPWTDIQLDVEGKTLYVSKSFLATISPVFRLMFESDFKEKNVDVLSLPDKKYEDVLTFLQCANPGVLQTVNYANIHGVFPLAHEYQVQRLLEECKKCLQKELSGNEVVSQPMKYNLDGSAVEDIQEIDFLRESPWTDVQLDVEGKTLYVSKSFIATISPVFRLMLESDFKEKNVNVLPLPGKKYDDVVTFLRCANPGVNRTVNYADIRGVLPLAHEYQVHGLLEECKNCMLTELLSVPMNIFDSNYRQTSTYSAIRSYCEICSLAEEYRLEDLLEICVEKFTNINVKWYMNVPMFQKISTKLQNRIFCNRLLVVEKAVK